MLDSSSASGDRVNHANKLGRTLMWAGHYASTMLIIAAFTSVICTLLNKPDWLSKLDAASWTIAWASTLIQFGYHDHKVCLHCINEPPFHDPDTAVARRDRELRYYHRFTLLIVIMMVVTTIMQFVDGISHHPLFKLSLSAFNVVFYLVFAYLAFTLLTHRRLELWCQYCGDEDDDDDDGDDDDGDEPDPTGPAQSTEIPREVHRTR